MRVSILTVSVGAALALGGCASHEERGERYVHAEKAIDRAEASGAEAPTNPNLREARRCLDCASELENASIEERNDGVELRDKATTRATNARSRLDAAKAELVRAESERDGHRRSLDGLASRRESLRGQGLAPEEIARVVGNEESVAKSFLRSSDSRVAVLEQEIVVLEKELADAELARQAGEARIATSEERRKLSEKHYDRAREEARAAEVRTLDRTRNDARARIHEVGKDERRGDATPRTSESSTPRRSEAPVEPAGEVRPQDEAVDPRAPR